MRWYGSLRRSGEIAFVRRRGRTAGTATLVGHAAPRRSGTTEVAVTVSKSVGGAVVRNRVRRRIKGALDARCAPRVALRLVLVARPAAATEPYGRVAADLDGIIERLAPP